MSSIRETAERIAERHHPSQTLTQTIGLIADIEQALRNERERAAKLADERAAFNLRLARSGKPSDSIDSRVADLKITRADEAEIIAKEIRTDD